ncbi:MAG: nucleotidyltransferase domain-containing protein [Thermodesulfobacteriota bacterium]
MREVTRRLVEVADPVRVVLFGSHASGTAGADSDLDILVVERSLGSAVAEMARLRRAVGRIGIPVDILVCSEQEAADWGHLPGTALYWALREGKVLYEAAR